MDKEFRALERQVAAEPSKLPLLLRAAARAGRLGEYADSFSSYFQLFSQEGLETKIAQANPGYHFLSYQKKIIEFHLSHKGSGNFSSLGTLSFETSLGALRVLFEDGVVNNILNKCLVVCVPACGAQIETAINQFAPEYRGQIEVISYHRTWRQLDRLLEEKYPIIICDEVHKIKNKDAKQSQAVYQLGDQAVYRFGLTGVPISSSLLDVFGLMRFINPEVFGKSYNVFRKKYFQNTPGDLLPRYSIKSSEMEKEIIDAVYQNAVRFVFGLSGNPV
jgi:hypothetical protein